MESRTLQERLFEEISRLTGKSLAYLLFGKDKPGIRLAEMLVLSDLPTPRKDMDITLDRFEELINTDEEVKQQTIKILALMEASNSLDQFQQLNTIRRGRNKTGEMPKKLEGFDKLLKAFLAVPKPKEGDIKRRKHDSSSANEL